MAQKPLFFLHLPRTAGTTIDAILTRHFAPQEVLKIYAEQEYREHREHSREELAAYKYITGHLLLTGMTPPTFCNTEVDVFTLLREPIGRLVSEYRFLRTWDKNHLYRLLNDGNISFADYVRSDVYALKFRGKNFMTRCISGMGFNSAYPVAALATAKKNLERVFVFFGLQERFLESLLLLGDMLGVQDLLHERRNALKVTDEIPISEDDLALARELNRADVELYAFAEALFAERVAAKGPEFQKRVQTFSLLNGKFQKISSLLYRQAAQGEAANMSQGIDLPKESRWQ